MRAEIQEWLDLYKDHPRAEGVTATDMLDLPPVLNQILRVLLAHGPMTQPQIRAQLASLPDSLWVDESDLPGALGTLVDQQWLLRSAANTKQSEPQFRINLRTKARVSAVTRGREALDF
jgi:hypothetical protein